MEKTEFEYDLLSKNIERSIQQLNDKLENIVIEGLKMKGFEFGNRHELESFIKENVKCEDHVDKKERIYYVKDIPFLLHKYEIEISWPISLDREIKMFANYGQYSCL